nr:acetamidase/formamidase family protein [Acidovorax sp.]
MNALKAWILRYQLASLVLLTVLLAVVLPLALDIFRLNLVGKYRQACLNAIEYLKKFGYSGAQAYSILGTAPVQGHISGVVDVANACATLWLPTQIFDFDINPSAAGPIKHLDGSVAMPLSPDLV